MLLSIPGITKKAGEFARTGFDFGHRFPSLTHEHLAMVSVVQREWAAKNPRATFKTPITVEDVLNSRMIAYPFRLLRRCLVADGGGALILVAAERARNFPQSRSTSSAPAKASRRRWSAK
jgi:acetyl-CoA acetyltransferase